MATAASAPAPMAAAPSAAPSTSKEINFQGREKQKDIRHYNIVAAKAVADCIRTSLGPKGMDKMITAANGEVVITNDGATILKQMDVLHPAARMFVDLSRAQAVEAGDGTTSVVVIAGALLTAAENLLAKGIHPSVISDAWLVAQRESERILKSVAIPADLSARESLVQSAITSLNSKVVSQNSALLAPLAVDAVLRIVDPKHASNVYLSDIRVVKKVGGTIEDTEMVDGLLFDQAASHSAGGPTSIKNAKIGLIQYCLSPPKTNMENSVVVDDYQQIDRLLREERAYILKLLKPIIKSGCNVLLIQKSILRDAVNDLALHYLAKHGIMVLKDIERNEIEFVSSTLGCTPIADNTAFSENKLGFAELVEEVSTAGGKIVKVTGVKNPGRTVSILVRGSNRLVLDEADRSIHDALCVVRSLVKVPFLITGGGSPEMELCLQLGDFGDKLGGLRGYCIRAFAMALEIIPYTLSENAGLPPIGMVTELRRRHVEGNKHAGINVRVGAISDMAEEKVLQPLLVTLSALNLATECVRMILKIDDIVGVR
jgi:T-complex protein 1 subunit delta